MGGDVAADTTRSRQEAVKNAAKKFKRSERYVWDAVKLGAKMHAAALAVLEKEAARHSRSRPRTTATVFLLTELRRHPRMMKEIETLGHRSGIAISTLRRAGKDLDVKKRRIGGKGGHWTWELPPNVKKKFGIEV